MKSRDTAKPWRPNFPNSLKNFMAAPEDEFEDELSFSSDLPIPQTDTNLGTSDMPYETPVEDVMEIIQPKKPKDTETPEPIKREQTRIKIFTAPTPEQLTNKVNTYLEQAETDERLSTFKTHDIQYSSNDQGYSVLIVLKM